MHKTAEDLRLEESAKRQKNWQRWGPYLSERQWGTVREDYSADGSCWDYFTHDQSRSRTYRWGEDGLLGLTDRQCRLCFGLSLWNEKDSILKERLFGLTGPEGNHGEDVKEYYFYLAATPTHSYSKALYKYPHKEFPYRELLAENLSRGVNDPEFELADTGIFDNNAYSDVFVEYAKADENDILIRIQIHNRGTEPKAIHCLPTLWFRNTWSWGRSGEGYTHKPLLYRGKGDVIQTQHSSLEDFVLAADSKIAPPRMLFTENETNFKKLYGIKDASDYSKDSFHRYVVEGEKTAVNPKKIGTKAAYYYRASIPAGDKIEIRLRLTLAESECAKRGLFFGSAFDEIFTTRIAEHDEFYAERNKHIPQPSEQALANQAYAGLIHTKQFYYYSIKEWLEGDPTQPKPAANRAKVRNSDWKHLYNRDIISMPDKWEYPWYAAWDLAFHMLPFARIDPVFAKRQLLLMLKEWYMHPNGQMPAYEFAFSDVNPPVHAWSCWRVYKMTAEKGKRDRLFLARAFQKLLINFTWWVNQKDIDGKNLFSGGFLGLDNIGIFNRSDTTKGLLQQADGTAWMAFYCGTMLSMALELAMDDPAYEDLASKFFEHFIAITDAINSMGGSGLWSKDDNFYYDHLLLGDGSIPVRLRSLVGLLPMIAVEVIKDGVIEKLPKFRKRMLWFLENRGDLSNYISYMSHTDSSRKGHRLLAIPSEDRLRSILRYMLDEKEFLSPYGIRSLSKIYAEKPYQMTVAEQHYEVHYTPGESDTAMFGGNSNWRGPIWFPVNFLLIEALQRYHYFYGDRFKVECPVGSGIYLNLKEVAKELTGRLINLFSADAQGVRPYHGTEKLFSRDANWKDHHLFYEYFHGETGRGLGASHQTGWTALVVLCMEKFGKI
jgi:hypothetical protein